MKRNNQHKRGKARYLLVLLTCIALLPVFSSRAATTETHPGGEGTGTLESSPSRGITVSGDSLAYYLEVAGRNNPGLNASFMEYKASLERVNRSGAWPDPELEIGFFLKPMEIVGGRQVADFTLMQMFPWFGTKKAAQTEATHMAKMAYAQFTETRDNLYLGVYTNWYRLSTLVQQLRNNRDTLQL